MRILITGAGGQLGRDLRPALSTHDVTALSRAELDVTDPAAVVQAVVRVRPRVIVHCAALTDTARCERDPELAHAVNAQAAAYVAAACGEFGARLVAISTNEVFDGGKRTPYDEDDDTCPLNAYGRSKREGEVFATAAWHDTLIVRTSWVYGHGGTNFVEKVRAAAAAGRPLRFVTDEVAAPTASADLAAAIAALVEREAPPGIYHLVNEGEASRYEWARAIVRRSGFDDSAVEPVTTEELRAAGYEGPRKPAYSVLANNRARALGVTLRPWEQALRAYFEGAKAAADG